MLTWLRVRVFDVSFGTGLLNIDLVGLDLNSDLVPPLLPSIMSLMYIPVLHSCSLSHVFPVTHTSRCWWF